MVLGLAWWHLWKLIMGQIEFNRKLSTIPPKNLRCGPNDILLGLSIYQWVGYLWVTLLPFLYVGSSRVGSSWKGYLNFFEGRFFMSRSLMRILITDPIKIHLKMWVCSLGVTYSWGTHSQKSVSCLLVGSLLWGSISSKRWEGCSQVV